MSTRAGSTQRGRAELVAVVAGPLPSCIGLGALIGGDPLLALEIASAIVIGLWAALLAREVHRSRRLSSLLSRQAYQTSLFGVRCRVTPALHTDAVVVGSIRPVIFVGASLLAALSDEELRAVLFHEDHHRRTFAPLRAAALAAWLHLLRRSSRVHGIVAARLSDLEVSADAHAIKRGSSPRTLARALLKGGSSPAPVSFGYDAERRIGQLLDRATDAQVQRTARLPYEWLPAIVIPMVALGCHVAL